MSDKKNWYSVSELAEHLNKSESTIKRLAKKLQSIEAGAVRYEGKKIFISTDHLPLVMSDHERPTSDNDRPLSDHMSDGKNNALELELAEIKERERQRLEHTIEQLELELAEKNKQIDKLTTTIENMTETTELQNKLLDNLRLQIKTPVMLPPVRSSWWQRIFGK